MFRLQCGVDRPCAGITLPVQAYGACSTSHYLSTLCVSTRFWLPELNLEPGDGLNHRNPQISVFSHLLNIAHVGFVLITSSALSEATGISRGMSQDRYDIYINTASRSIPTEGSQEFQV